MTSDLLPALYAENLRVMRRAIEVAVEGDPACGIDMLCDVFSEAGAGVDDPSLQALMDRWFDLRKTKQKKIWLVTRGEHSDDYSVLAAFSTRDQAEAAAHGRGCDVEDIDLDPTFRVIPSNWNYYRVLISEEGQITKLDLLEGEVFVPLDEADDDNCSLVMDSTNKSSVLFVFVLAESKEHAAKIANEWRQKLAAAGWDKGRHLYCDLLPDIRDERP